MTAIKEGEYTATIFKLIKESQYVDAIQILTVQLQKHPKSRAALSLLGYCYYHIQDFGASAECYEQLTQLHPEVEDYKVYYAQSLYKAGAYPEATKASFALDNTSSHTKMLKLQACIKYCEQDNSAAKSLLEQLPQDDPDYIYNMGCLLYQDGKYEDACKKFTSAMQVLGYVPALSYNIALCHYSLKMYPQALKHVEDIKNRGIKEHPELSVGMTSEGVDFHSVGNTLELQQTALIEALNLKAAIEYQLKNVKTAQEALTDMPPRSEQELDPVTLHNQALLNMDTKPSEGFEKLAFLLQQPSFPPVTFANLLLLYCKYEYFDLAADVLAENAHLTYKFLTPYIYEFLDALLMSQTTPEEAFRKLDDMCGKLTEQLRKLAKQVQMQTRDEEAQKKAVQEYNQMLEKYIVVLMAQAKIYWNRENYQMVEKIFHKSLEVWCEDDTLRLNIAHVLFMQNKYKKAISFYEPIVKKHYDNILNVSAVVLANLCVSHIMTSNNAQAEELMKKIEKEEEQISNDDPNKKVFHHCIVNLVIGTLYCAKGNYEFGISRVIKSLEPYNNKLGTDTWFYAKRCLLSLLENMAKHMVEPVDSVIKECIQFLEQCEVFGKTVPALIEHPLEESRIHIGKNTVAYEARKLLSLLYEVTGRKE
ncbi:intraflagellar transport protein 70A isoform X2 [Takifugu rubripes]|uniref:intraflagellar transport protein 70A isoform X2 n=1 Tax=Takifugu rubripes TaxID=31033 RepID=UPI0005D25907|nr:tetratricopeptide repeat protein 30A-like isoform X2 [Takifugu rubripes]|eukprot:XP_011602611.1 PREDICTED: tetratricopeptide repeat protein 30A-like isoform X2 [Takifugu rubripes]